MADLTLRELAQLGAQARIRELQVEIAQLEAAVARVTGNQQPRRQLTDAQKAQISRRMKETWRKRRQAQRKSRKPS